MTIPQKPFVAVRFDLPLKHHEQLRHLCVSEHRPASELLVDAVELLLRYHEVPGVSQPRPSQKDEDQEVEIAEPRQQGAKS